MSAASSAIQQYDDWISSLEASEKEMADKTVVDFFPQTPEQAWQDYLKRHDGPDADNPYVLKRAEFMKRLEADEVNNWSDDQGDLMDRRLEKALQERDEARKQLRQERTKQDKARRLLTEVHAYVLEAHKLGGNAYEDLLKICEQADEEQTSFVHRYVTKEYQLKRIRKLAERNEYVHNWRDQLWEVLNDEAPVKYVPIDEKDDKPPETLLLVSDGQDEPPKPNVVNFEEEIEVVDNGEWVPAEVVKILSEHEAIVQWRTYDGFNAARVAMPLVDSEVRNKPRDESRVAWVDGKCELVRIRTGPLTNPCTAIVSIDEARQIYEELKQAFDQ